MVDQIACPSSSVSCRSQWRVRGKTFQRRIQETSGTVATGWPAYGENFFLPTFPSGSWWVGYALRHDGLYHVFRFNPIIFICYLDCSSFSRKSAGSSPLIAGAVQTEGKWQPLHNAIVDALITHIVISTYSSFTFPLELLQQFREIHLAVSLGLLKSWSSLLVNQSDYRFPYTSLNRSNRAPVVEVDQCFWKLISLN